MTTLVWRGECLWMRPGKGSLRGVARSPEAKPAVDQYQAKPLQTEFVRPIREFEKERRNAKSWMGEK